MKILKNILVIAASIVSVFVTISSIKEPSGPIIMGGCFDSTKVLGWPLAAYTTSGEFKTCGEGYIAAQWHLSGLFLDAIVLFTISYWLLFIFQKITKKS